MTAPSTKCLSMKSLDLSMIRMNNNGCDLLLSNLGRNQSLVTLKLVSNGLSDASSRPLSTYLKSNHSL